jgi:polar amino acid transport system substrate-binding protein
MKKTLVTLAFFLLINAPFAFAQSSIPIFTSEWRPLVSEQLPRNGPIAEIVAAACIAGGIKMDLKFAPWVRTEIMVKSGQAFAAFPYVDTADRRAKYWVSDPIYVEKTVLFFYLGNPKTPATFIELKPDYLKDLSIGTVRGSYLGELMPQLGLDKYVETYSVDSAAQMLQKGRLDFLAIAPSVGKDAFLRLFPTQLEQFLIVRNSPFPPKSSNVMIISKDFPQAKEFLAQFNKGLAAIKKSGEYKKILSQHSLDIE